jgi:hypothetical protein
MVFNVGMPTEYEPEPRTAGTIIVFAPADALFESIKGHED